MPPTAVACEFDSWQFPNSPCLQKWEVSKNIANLIEEAKASSAKGSRQIELNEGQIRSLSIAEDWYHSRR